MTKLDKKIYGLFVFLNKNLRNKSEFLGISNLNYCLDHSQILKSSLSYKNKINKLLD